MRIATNRVTETSSLQLKSLQPPPTTLPSLFILFIRSYVRLPNYLFADSRSKAMQSVIL